MNKKSLKILKNSGEVAIVALVVLALVIGIVRSFFPFIDRYRPNIAEKISSVVHQPVTIGQLQTSWRSWSPAVRLANVQIYDKNTHQPLLHIKEVHISVNILASLLHWKWVPDKFFVSDTQLEIHQLDAISYDINGIRLDLPKFDHRRDVVQETLYWLATQGEFSFDHLTLNFYPKNASKLAFKNLDLQIQHGFFEQRVIASGVLVQAKPSPFRLTIRLKEDLDSSVRAKAYAVADNLDLAPFSQWLHGQNFSITQGHLPRIQVWANWKEDKIASIQSLFQLQQAQVSFSTAQQKKQELIGNFEGNILWENQDHGWSVAGNSIRMQLGNEVWPVHQFNFARTNNSQTTNLLAVDHLDVQQLSKEVLNTSLLTSDQMQMLDHIRPQGRLNDLFLQMVTKPQQASDYTLTVKMNQISTQVWEKIPAVNNLQGQLYLTSKRGHAELNGQNVSINLPKLESAPIRLASYQFIVDWLHAEDGWRITFRDSSFTSPGLNFKANMDLYLYDDDLGGPYIRLLGDFFSPDVHALRNFIPDRYFKAELAHWLQDALVKGNADGQLSLQGPVQHFPFDDNTGRFQILAQTHAIDFNYKKQWPLLQKVDSILEFDDRSLFAESRQAKILGQPLSFIHAEIPNLIKSDLSLTSSINTNARFAQRYILQSPLEKPLGEAFRSFTIDAPMHLNLNLQLPLYHDAKDGLQVDGKAKIFPGTLSLLGSTLKLQQFQGDIAFTENSVDADNLKGLWLTKPVTIVINTSGKEQGKPVVALRSQSKLAIADLVQLSNSPNIAKFLSGETEFTAGLVVRKLGGETKTVYTLDTNFQGVNIKLPDPWNKAAEEKAPTHMELQFIDQGKGIHILLNYKQQLSAAIVLEKKGETKWAFRGANLHLGAGNADFIDAPGISIEGNLAYLNWSRLSDYLNSLTKSSGAGKRSLKVNQVNLGFGELEIFGMKLSSARLRAQSTADAWNIQIDSPTIAGQMTVPKNLRQGITGNFQRFIIMSDSSSNSPTRINPGKIPPLNVHFDNLVYGSRSFGSVNITTFPSGNMLQIQKISANLPGFSLSASGQWQGYGQEQMTVLNGSYTAKDMGSILKKWQVTGSLLGAASKGSFSLKWLGPAYSPNLAKLDGKFSFTMNKGQILNIGQSSQAEMGIGRILNLLSLQSVPRRLSFDFSDLTTQGFPFDQMSGDFAIQDGNAVTNNTELKGPLAEVDTKGRIGLAAKDYNLILIIVPKVTGSLPVAATIVGGPVIGAAAWVANKLVEPVVGQIISVSYRVTGPWTNPVMEKAN